MKDAKQCTSITVVCKVYAVQELPVNEQDVIASIIIIIIHIIAVLFVLGL